MTYYFAYANIKPRRSHVVGIPLYTAFLWHDGKGNQVCGAFWKDRISLSFFFCLHLRSLIIYRVIIIIISLKVFHISVSWCFSQEYKWQQVFSGLQDSSQYSLHNAVHSSIGSLVDNHKVLSSGWNSVFVCISKSQRILYVSFSWTDSGLCIIPLVRMVKFKLVAQSPMYYHYYHYHYSFYCNLVPLTFGNVSFKEV